MMTVSSRSAHLSSLSETPELKLSFPHPIYDESDYELRCEARNVAPVQNLRVTWFTGNQTLRTDTFNESSVTPVNVTSTLNITTDKKLKGQVFGCKAELDLGPLEPEFQPPTQLLEAPLDVLCRSSPCAVLVAFKWLRLISAL